MDDALLHCSVFKFSLQPVLENCFSHAFKGDTGRAKLIHVNIFSRDKDLIITIKDNGFGIDDESLEKLQLLLISDAEPDQPHHVGLANVHKRITTVFGSDYGITVERSHPGTVVSIRYPSTMKK